MPAALRRRILPAVALGVAISLFAGLPAAQAAGGATPAPGETQLISAGTSGGVGDDGSTDTSVSPDGRFVAFTSAARNLTSLPVPPSKSQVYVRDVTSGQTVLVSVNAVEKAGGNSNSYNPSISDDGRYVAFASDASDLDTSVTYDGHTQIYLRDLTTGSTQLVSRNPTSRAAGVYNSFQPSLSGDGSRLAFGSIATNLLPGTSFDVSQIFGAEMKSGVMTVVRLLSTRDANLPSPGRIGNGDSYSPSLSRDGTVVAFASKSTNLSSNAVSGTVYQVFLHAIDSGSTGLVSVVPDGSGGGNGDSRRPVVSADGRRIAYDSKAGNLSPKAVGTVDEQVYLRDTSALASQLVSVNQSGATSAIGPSFSASISDDGQRVAFASYAGDLVRADVGGSGQAYWRDVRLGVTSLVSATAADPLRGSAGGGGNPSISGDGRLVAFSASRDLLGGTETEPAQVYLQGLEGPRVERIGGADRFAVSARVSAETFPPGVPVAYVASGAVFSDALSGSAIAGAQGGPVLLVGKDSVPEAIATELKRLKPAKIVVLGGLNTISAGVETALSAFGAGVSRIAGTDRFAVSASISANGFAPSLNTAYVASGAVFPDALSGSAAAGLLGGPVLLVDKDVVPAAITAELTRLKPKNIVVLGGTNSISDATFLKLKPLATQIKRVDGLDRFEVSANVSQDVFQSRDVVYVASGAVFPDALSGSAAAIADKSPVLLVTKDSIPPSVATQLDRLDPYRIVVLGGPNTISDTVKDELEKYLRR
ncbi:cell wall-binding repeat-containing protein [Herbiconiux sp. CPCC 205763]|uniref:Cell wall-binding repeat-containing protein n=1 Tax=Herbiconiux aconitum TaxID=2970913 RepID=A0ABT2GPX6_9MICO|nr:cell wall-binding repeat-containing protein [Herbiconiux aconitum]MCS5716989.1 cell wall-binding repeat-containing protein [Herbiconiux aconitum]